MSVPADLREAVARLADKDRRMESLRELGDGGDAGIDAAIEGLSDPHWQVRRWCAIFLDHHSTAAARERLKLTLEDPKAKVRMWAVHSIACEPCKPGQQLEDVVSLILKRLREDKALRVRRQAVVVLVQHLPDRRVYRAFRKSLKHETDERLRRLLKWGLYVHEQAVSNAG
jgi:HEAT repeat protein